MNRRRLLAFLAALPAALALNIAQEPSTADARKGKRKEHKDADGGSGGRDAPDGEEHAFLVLINDYRRRNGRGALVAQHQLETAAERHSRDQATNSFSSHTGSNGSTVGRRITDAGYRYTDFGENIYWNSNDGSAEAAFTWWKLSRGHDANMLSADFTQIGISRAQSGTSGTWYWTTDFGRPQ